MEQGRLVYKILRILERSMDYEEFDSNIISAETLKVSEPRWCFTMEMLIDKGYVTGVKAQRINYPDYPFIQIQRPSITLDGLEYLYNNNYMIKIANTLKEVI